MITRMNSKTFVSLLGISLSLLLTGCAAQSSFRLSMMSPEELMDETINELNLCHSYSRNNSDKIKTELLRRDSITRNDWALISQKKIQRGMSELALVCSWGAPGLYGSRNQSVGSWGVHTQWVYRSCDICSAKYVYTENGKVTSWQN